MTLSRLRACLGLSLVFWLLSTSLTAEVPGGDFSLRILGSGGPGFSAQRAESSVLLRFGQELFLVDMGDGTQKGLSEAKVKESQLSALFITHHHTDHDQEFAPILAGSLLGRKAPAVIGPSGTRALAEFTATFYGRDLEYRRAAIGIRGSIPDPEIREVAGGEDFSLGGVSIRTTAVNHSIETIAYRFEARGQSVVMSGDLTYSDSLVTLARQADLLVLDGGAAVNVDNSMKGTRQGVGSDRQRAHADLEEVLRMAVASGVKQVLLTHLPNRIIDEARIRSSFMAAGFSGQVSFAKDGLEFPLR